MAKCTNCGQHFSATPHDDEPMCDPCITASLEDEDNSGELTEGELVETGQDTGTMSASPSMVPWSNSTANTTAACG